MIGEVEAAAGGVQQCGPLEAAPVDRTGFKNPVLRRSCAVNLVFPLQTAGRLGEPLLSPFQQVAPRGSPPLDGPRVSGRQLAGRARRCGPYPALWTSRPETAGWRGVAEVSRDL